MFYMFSNHSGRLGFRQQSFKEGTRSTDNWCEKLFRWSISISLKRSQSDQSQSQFLLQYDPSQFLKTLRQWEDLSISLARSQSDPSQFLKTMSGWSQTYLQVNKQLYVYQPQESELSNRIDEFKFILVRISCHAFL